MKKIIISSLVFAMITSCSSSNDDPADNNSNNNNTPYLLKKSTEISQDGSSYVIEYKYDGTRITESYDVTDKEKVAYTYDGDNIVKAEVYRNGVLKITREYTYSNGKLVSQKVTDKHQPGTLVYTETFQYLTNNHVKHHALQTYTYNSATETYSDIKYMDKDIYLDANGNPLSVTYENNGTTRSTTFSYDNNNHPMKNVKGYIKMDLFSLEDGELGYNNLLKAEEKYTGSVNGYRTTTVVHTLNPANYPTKSEMTYTSSSFGPYKRSYLYEYNK